MSLRINAVALDRVADWSTGAVGCGSWWARRFARARVLGFPFTVVSLPKPRNRRTWEPVNRRSRGRSARRLAFLKAALVIALSLGGGFATACASGGGASIHSASVNDDAAITARVKTALLNDTQINATRIDVSTSGGVVTLSGTVKSQAEIDRAVQLTRSAPGVRDVKPELRVGGE